MSGKYITNDLECSQLGQGKLTATPFFTQVLSSLVHDKDGIDHLKMTIPVNFNCKNKVVVLANYLATTIA